MGQGQVPRMWNEQGTLKRYPEGDELAAEYLLKLLASWTQAARVVN